MEKEYIAGESQRYEIGGRVFIVEPRYRKDGESMADILLTKPVNIGAAAPLSQEGGLPYQTYMRLRVSNRIRMACLETWKI